VSEWTASCRYTFSFNALWSLELMPLAIQAPPAALRTIGKRPNLADAYIGNPGTFGEVEAWTVGSKASGASRRWP